MWKELVWALSAVVAIGLAFLLPPRIAVALGLLLALVWVVVVGFSLSNSEACNIDPACPTSERVSDWIGEGLFFPAPVLVVVGLGRLLFQRRSGPPDWRRWLMRSGVIHSRWKGQRPPP